MPVKILHSSFVCAQLWTGFGRSLCDGSPLCTVVKLRIVTHNDFFLEVYIHTNPHDEIRCHFKLSFRALLPAKCSSKKYI